MTILVTDRGFAPDDWIGGDSDASSLDVGPDTDPLQLAEKLTRATMIRVNFPSFSDGRGFSIARQIRLMGYGGRLRARGHVLADQYAMARRAGFDEVEIDRELAARQPEAQWRARANWKAHDYQARLRG